MNDKNVPSEIYVGYRPHCPGCGKPIDSTNAPPLNTDSDITPPFCQECGGGDECRFCRGGKKVIAFPDGGELRCPECRGSGLQKDVNEHTMVEFFCERCRKGERVLSNATSPVLALFHFLEAHTKCVPT